MATKRIKNTIEPTVTRAFAIAQSVAAAWAHAEALAGHTRICSAANEGEGAEMSYADLIREHAAAASYREINVAHI